MIEAIIDSDIIPFVILIGMVMVWGAIAFSGLANDHVSCQKDIEKADLDIEKEIRNKTDN